MKKALLIPIVALLAGIVFLSPIPLNAQPPEPMDLELWPREVVPLGDPTGSQWHELHPVKSNFYTITGWEPGKVLSPCDQIVMERVEPPSPPVIEEFEVNEVTIDLVVYDMDMGILRWLDYKCGYWLFKKYVWENPVCSKWNEIKNEYEGPVDPPHPWHLTDWIDNGDGKLSFCDDLLMTPLFPFPGPPMPCHVEQVTVTVDLLSKFDFRRVWLEYMGPLEEFQDMDRIHNPVCTMWHEILPIQSQIWHLADWLDTGLFSPSDQIVLHRHARASDAEYHVEKVTVAMNLTSMVEPFLEHIVKFEGSLKQFIKFYWGKPISTQWHEVNPRYCMQWHITDWFDTDGSGLLDFCDLILMMDKETGDVEEFHVESLSTDIFVQKKIPVGGVWIPVDKLGLLAPYIALTSTIVVATLATAIYVKRTKRREKQ